MTHRTKDTATGVQFLLRACGVVFASALMFLLLAALGAGAGTAEAAGRPAGLGDLLGGDAPLGPQLAPVTAPVVDVAPILDSVTQPLTPVVAPVITTVAPILEPVTQTVTPVVVPVVATVTPVVVPVVAGVEPIVDTVLRPVTDTVIPVVDSVADTVKPVVDTVVPDTSTVRPPASDPVLPDTVPTPGGTTAPSQPGSLLTVAPNAPNDAGSVVTAPAVDLVAIDTATPAAPGLDSAEARLPSTGSAATTPELTRPAPVARILDVLVATDASTGAAASPSSASPAASSSFPARPSAGLPSIVSGLLSGATSSAPAPGAPSSLLAVLTATVAAMFLMSRRVTAEVSWRSALVLSSVERPG